MRQFNLKAKSLEHLLKIFNNTIRFRTFIFVFVAVCNFEGAKRLTPHHCWKGKICTFNYFRVVEIRSKCRFFPECWFHKVEKGANFSMFTVGFRIKEEFKISAQFQLLNVEYAKFQAEN